MREKTYHLYLNEEERSRVIQSLIELKNNLAAQGRYTDAGAISEFPENAPCILTLVSGLCSNDRNWTSCGGSNWIEMV